MIRHKLSLFVICVALATQGQVLCRWTADSSRSSQVAFDCYRGETLLFVPSFAAYGTPVTNYTATLLWQTNGMGTAWWSTNVLAFTPEMDVGASRYTVFIRAAMTNGVNYRANGTITMRNSPGFTPNALPLPVSVIDFATVTTTNAPWLLAESDPGIQAAIASAVAQADTNAQATAAVAQANAVAFASTNKMTRIYNPSDLNQYIDGAGNKYVVSNFWNMTFSADFAGVNNPAQTNYLFTSLSQYYYEDLGFGRYWRMAPNEVRYLPSTLTSTRQWIATTNAFVLDPVAGTGAEGYAILQYWATTNLIATLATEAQLASKADASRTITVNGSTGSLSSNLTFTVSPGLSTNDVTSIANTAVHGAVFTNQIWYAPNTNATYRMSWDVTNGTFKVEEILP